MMDIYLENILNLGNLQNFKVHCAVWNGYNQPLDVFARDKNEWDDWNSYKGQKNEFNRKYIFSLMDFYHEEGTWLFGGIYEVLSVEDGYYKIRLTDMASAYVGRLKLRFTLSGRNRRIKLENYISDFIVAEVLPAPYSGQSFVGFDDIDLTFEQLEIIIRNQKPDWRGALQSVKGVYLITDTNNGKRYVGSAYGEYGIWSRWQTYMETGHGWNEGLITVVNENGIEYIRRNFKFSLLEYRSFRTEDKSIIERETFWKNVLLTNKFGYNMN